MAFFVNGLQDDELDVAPVDIDDALVIEEDDISDDDEDEDNDDVCFPNLNKLLFFMLFLG